MINREIKFRAWKIDWKNKNLKQNQGRMIQWKDIKDDFTDILIKTSYFILMQYTGLKDKNGVEIYEGDILEDIGEVVWVELSASFRINPSKKNKDISFTESFVNYDEKDREIIGNIYDKS